MKIGHIMGSGASGTIIYVAMAAACASSDGAGSGADGGGSGSPVPNASAAAPPATLDVAAETCSKPMTYTTAPGVTAQWVYAEHEYPGASAAELASSVSVITSVPTGNGSTAPPGYGQSETFFYVRDGFVSVPCGAPDLGPNLPKLTFIRRL